MTKRLFFAVELDEATRAQITDIADRLKKGAHFTAAKLVWVPQENYHLTLWFLGDVSQSVADRLAAGLPTTVQDMEPFEVDCRHLGTFPEDDRKPPKVLWFGTHRVPEALHRLRQNCASLIVRNGIPLPEQNFSPHVTLARFKSTKDVRPFRSLMKNYQFAKAGKSKVTRVVLIESQTGGGQARYVPYATADFPEAVQ